MGLGRLYWLWTYIWGGGRLITVLLCFWGEDLLLKETAPSTDTSLVSFFVQFFSFSNTHFSLFSFLGLAQVPLFFNMPAYDLVVISA